VLSVICGDERGERNAFAIMRPIPLLPPVTNATRPFTEKRLLIFVEAMAGGTNALKLQG
jgi:hypothetical protein